MKKKIVAMVMAAICMVPFLYIFVMSLSPKAYYEVFLAQSQYLIRFWWSIFLSICIALGQTTISVFAGFGFAKCRFKGRDMIFFMLMLLMIMPLQVTLVPNYLMLDQMGLLDTYYALALPMIFVPLGTFIMTQCFKAVPNDVIEAARLDGCNTLGVIVRIITPMNKCGLICTMLLSFLDGWNMVEQPMVYLKDFASYPLSVGLASSFPGNTAIQLVCCVLAVFPPFLLFAYYQRELVEGIATGGDK